jgi:membrane-associated protease RseP (regulator of RpoE activity)
MRPALAWTCLVGVLIELGGSTATFAQNDRARNDQQTQGSASDFANVILQFQDQSKQSAYAAGLDFVQNPQLQNQSPHQQPNAYWAWTNNGDGLAWLALHNDRFSGMSVVPVDAALRAHLKLPKDQGLLVTALDPHAPAASAGLHQNDVLLKVGDSPLANLEDLEAALKAAGDKPVVLQLYRDGSSRKVQVQPRIQVSFGPVPAQPVAQEFWIGVSVADVEPALRAQLRIPSNQGLLVNEVYKESPAEKADIKVNDILILLNGTPLSDQKKLVELVQANGEKTIILELLHEGKPRGGVEITPQRRKFIQRSDPTKPLHSFRWDFVRPGALLNQASPYQFQFRDLNDVINQESKLKDQLPKEPNAALSKRLDELDGEIKKLRKALEELGGASKSTEELNRVIELLKKLSADKK